MPATLETILDDLYFSATSEADKGSKFELLMASYLRTDPQYADQFDQVWPWMEWPGRDGQGDHGIDLVAQERDTGDLVAIQCKFYDPRATLSKADIDSFLSASGKHPFRRRIVVSTTDNWGSNAEAAVHGQQIPVQRIRFKDLAESGIDWSQFSLATPEVLELKDRKRLRQHQENAISDVKDGFAAHDRGKMIMACGTGKTFTSLRLAEQTVGAGGSVLFLVPSIALLSQSLREWTGEAEVALQAFAVCSDPKASKTIAPSEDISTVDLPLAATTDPQVLHQRLTAAVPGRMRVVFATYQSIDVVAQAQRMGGVDPFDLIVCDEAHRTTGVTLVDDEDESAFVRVHNPEYVLADRRLYMTATPRVYGDNTKAKAGEANAVLSSMDDEDLYGPEFHRLSFGKAVAQGLLTDYKVLVLGVSEDAVSRTFQSQLADESMALRLDDVAKMVGCWNGLAKRGEAGFGFDGDSRPMGRAVAFAQTIKASKAFADRFERITDHYITSHDFDAELADGSGGPDRALRAEVDHVDGSMNALLRNNKLDWLRENPSADTARILSNARCLSEGVDVPSLDAVLFLHPRRSQVDIIQSVGRVMRLAPDKQYGYIILPVAIPAGVDPENALGDSRFKVIWDVLQALRAHDERFDAMINQIDLNKAPGERLEVIFTDFDNADDGATEAAEKGTSGFEQQVLDLPAIGQWRDAIYARIVTKVGTRRYWEDWAADIRDIAGAHITRIKGILAQPTPALSRQFDDFLTGLRANLNDSISRDSAIEMLSQHLITKPVFDALFEDYSFAEHNPVSRVMQTMVDALEDHHLETETETLEGFYESVRMRAAGIENAAGKQKIITELYESFFKNAFPKTAESLGIVYTPTQIVDFILRAVETVLDQEFGASISDQGVHVLDPFTGTGTFIVRLLESGLIRPEDLLRKYTSELHANELLLLAYYIGAINIEATLHGLLTENDPDAGYVPFEGIVLTDTFQMTEDEDTMDAVMFPANNARVENQKNLDLRVIVGNPPYSVGQTSGNDANANLKYHTLDKHIETTYAARSTATNKNSLYDSYIRAIRWASDRIGTEGVIGYVTNGGWLDSNTADGLRQTLAEEFAAIYIYNLRGNQRTAGEQSRREGGKVFGSGSRNTVAIMLLVKKSGHTGPSTVYYRDIGDYLTREDKLQIVAASALATLDWQTITPNQHGDWLSQRDEHFGSFTPIGSTDDETGVFAQYSGGVKTNRDAWVYNSSSEKLRRNVERMVDFYRSQVSEFTAQTKGLPTRDKRALVDDFIDLDPQKFSWNRADKVQVARGTTYEIDDDGYRIAAYRPFSKQHLHFDPQLNDMVYRQPRFFPTGLHDNIGYYVVGAGSDKTFSVIATDVLPDLAMWGSSSGQYFPRWTYKRETEDDLFSTAEEAGQIDGYQRFDNVTDATLGGYRAAYGPAVTKDDIFYYVYGLLHSSYYRIRYAADLKKMLPRIPQVATAKDFQAFVTAGRQLATLHIGYENVEPYPLTETITGTDNASDLFRVQKMRYPGSGKNRDRSTIIYNAHVTLSGIPEAAHRYMLGSRSAVDWILERYQVKTDKPSGIVNDPNDWAKEVGDPRYIIDLLKRVVTVSLETMKIVDTLPTPALPTKH